jgi:Tfp pilus assembly protein PilV
MIRFHKNQTGDTIVEVLIAVAVMGLSIGLAYGISNRSLKSARQTQERLEALKLVEGQVEQLKALSYSTDNKGIFSENSAFCINNGDKVVSTDLILGDLDSDPLTKYNSDCIKGLYHIAVKRNSNEFTIVARWFGINGLNAEEVKSRYRLFDQ